MFSSKKVSKSLSTALLFFLLHTLVYASSICYNAHCYDVELAATRETRAKGLMFRHTLAKNKGMLFIFDEKKRLSFWMKNTQIPLDIIFLDEQLQVMRIAEGIPFNENPVYSIKESMYVLELNKGQSKDIDLREGQFLTLSFEQL